ncbi:sensor histidine kinase [Actinospica sp.]|uniref:sensor histidine kinase n=1 Tax=Actinospica sp. TaxID=1872142 RepID=UPI002C3DDCF5|nr:ATP-binding protein [Actinospica sp.]HWG28123.1 ATP-binding protein [Actinospica sp.]
MSGMRVGVSSGRFGVRGWFYSVIATMVVLVIGFSVVGVIVFARASQASNNLISSLGPARTALVDMQSTLVDQENAIRGYLLTHDSDFLRPYYTGEQTLQRDVADAESQLTGHAKALGELEALEQEISGWKDEYAVPFITAAQQGESVDLTRLDASENAFVQLRGRFVSVENELDGERGQALQKLSHINAERNWTFVGMLAVFLLTVCFIVLLVQIMVLKPLRSLRQQARRVTEGAFDTPLTPSGPQDIRALSSGLDAMRAKLVESLDDTERHRAELLKQKETLDAQAEELRRSNEELEQFAYVASHDLQEPLRKVASFCQLIEKRYEENLDERGKQYIHYAVDGAKRMQVLINDLLTFSRVGRVNDRRERVELQACLDSALDRLEYAMEECRAKIVQRPLPAVTGDPTLLSMLWQNLVGNALKFRSPERPPEVSVSWAPDPDQPGFVRVSVADNGIGIPPAFAEKVFVIFQRLHSREAYSGTGIGLALCKKIVEHHGGRIWIDRERAVGTRFTFTLPAATAADDNDQYTDDARPRALEGTTS